MPWYDPLNNIFEKYLGPVWDDIINILKRFGISIENFFTAIFQGFLDFFKQIAIDVLSTVKNTINAIFASLQEILRDIGKGALFIADRINDGWNTLYTSVAATTGPLAPLVLTIILLAIFMAMYFVVKALLIVLIP